MPRYFEFSLILSITSPPYSDECKSVKFDYISFFFFIKIHFLKSSWNPQKKIIITIIVIIEVPPENCFYDQIFCNL